MEELERLDLVLARRRRLRQGIVLAATASVIVFGYCARRHDLLPAARPYVYLTCAFFSALAWALEWVTDLRRRSLQQGS